MVTATANKNVRTTYYDDSADIFIHPDENPVLQQQLENLKNSKKAAEDALQKALDKTPIFNIQDPIVIEKDTLNHSDASSYNAFLSELSAIAALANGFNGQTLNQSAIDDLDKRMKDLSSNNDYKEYLSQSQETLGQIERIQDEAAKTLSSRTKEIEELQAAAEKEEEAAAAFETKYNDALKAYQDSVSAKETRQKNAAQAKEERKQAIKEQMDGSPLAAVKTFYAADSNNNEPDLALLKEIVAAGGEYNTEQDAIILDTIEKNGFKTVDSFDEVNSYFDGTEDQSFDYGLAQAHVQMALVKGHETMYVETHDDNAFALIQKAEAAYNAKGYKIKVVRKAMPTPKAEQAAKETNGAVVENIPEEAPVIFEWDMTTEKAENKKPQNNLDDIDDIDFEDAPTLKPEDKKKTEKKSKVEKTRSSFKDNFFSLFGSGEKQKAHKAFVKEITGKDGIQAQVRDLQDKYRKRVQASGARGQILDIITQNSDQRATPIPKALEKVVKKHNIDSAYDVITSHMDSKYKALHPMNEGVDEIAKGYGLNLNDKHLMSIFGAKLRNITGEDYTPIFSTAGAYTKEHVFVAFAKQQADALFEEKQRNLALSGNSKDKPIVPIHELPFGETHEILDERYKFISGKAGQISGSVDKIPKKELSKDDQDVKDLYKIHELLVKESEHARAGYPQAQQKQKKSASFVMKMK